MQLHRHLIISISNHQDTINDVIDYNFFAKHNSK